MTTTTALADPRASSRVPARLMASEGVSARVRPPARPICIARIARHEPRAVAALIAGLRSGVGAALVRHTPAQALILARLEVAASEFFAAAPTVKARWSNF